MEQCSWREGRMSQTDLILNNVNVYTENNIIKKGCVVVRDQRIHAIGTEELLKQFPHAEIKTFSADQHLVPGFIDLHVHGVNGSDVMDNSVDALQNISYSLAKEGTTSFLATTMSAAPEVIASTLKTVHQFMQTKYNGAEVLGVHLEGPFIASDKANAQRADKIQKPAISLIEQWQQAAGNVIKLVTLAPELDGSLEFIAYLREKNIIASMGHTNATYAESLAAIEKGCTHVTHLFNAMRGLHQREPGIVTAALLSEKITTELIVDGTHLHPAIVDLTLKLKGKEKISLVTDAMRAKCLKNGVYDLGGQEVTVQDGIATLKNGTLAGSTLRMNDALRNMMKFTGCQLADAITMASETPAKELKVFDKKGSIAVGKDADVVVLDNELNVVMTVCQGLIIH